MYSNLFYPFTVVATVVVVVVLSTSTPRRTLLFCFASNAGPPLLGYTMSDSETETTTNVRSLENEKLDRILEQADNSDDTLYTVNPTCIDELDVSTYREQLQRRILHGNVES